MPRFAWVLLTLLTFCATALRYLPAHFFAPRPRCEAANFTARYNGFYTDDHYQQEARMILRLYSPEEFRYFWQGFAEEDGRKYMYVRFVGEPGCFVIRMQISRWDVVAPSIHSQAKLYNNELYDLNWRIKRSIHREEVVYLGMYEPFWE
jgi:hypothetical protein